MKKCKPIYTKDSLIYWPNYDSGTIAVIFLILLFVGSFIYATYPAFKDGWQKNPILAIVFIIWISLYVGILRFCRKIIGMKITLKTDMLMLGNEFCDEEKVILWEDVESIVYYKKDIGPGAVDGYCVFLKGINRKKTIWKAQYDYFIPVSGVDSKILRLYIPTFLLKNEPDFY